MQLYRTNNIKGMACSQLFLSHDPYISLIQLHLFICTSMVMPIHCIYSVAHINLHLFICTYLFAFIQLHLFIYTYSDAPIHLHFYSYTYSFATTHFEPILLHLFIFTFKDAPIHLHPFKNYNSLERQCRNPKAQGMQVEETSLKFGSK